MTFKIKDFGRKDYVETYNAMRNFSENRNFYTDDEIWLVEHPSVYTLGLSKKTEHIIDVGDIPVVATDRGGQVTYHGPGQLVIYLLIDLSRRSYKVKKLVSLIEASVIEYLKESGVNAERKLDAPGVYVDNQKIAALGLRVKKHRTYHGLALNVDMDRERNINKLFEILTKKNINITSMRNKTSRLEELFLKLLNNKD